MSVEESFESPRLLLSEAHADAKRLKTLLDDFFLNEKPCRIVSEYHPRARKGICYAEITKKPPVEMRLVTYRIVTNLRNALDHALYGACVALGQTTLEKTNFPFRDGPADLEHVFTKRGMCRDVPVALHDLLRSFQPYPRRDTYSGGNDYLIDLNRLANPNKHQVALRVNPIFQGVLNAGIWASSNGAIKPIIPPSWNRTKDKLAIFEVTRTTQFNYNIKINATVALSEPPLDGVSVEGFVSEQLPRTELIVNQIEAETRRILATAS